ncbi:hypothetical protein [Corynebacterium sp. HMSC29G08]|uniref:hypothetical protein n=1 Tax=Corynebacterium sp. HMSC29G08 TaxID=1581069 RepID=UPI0008A3C130|nr:hypothetical protein [Corynebacterium sp. HMSC29G08]OFT86324.1 hypothetical protein HMPREF3101_01015 [Corynebacterium sp. HMSC29G08]
MGKLDVKAALAVATVVATALGTSGCASTQGLKELHSIWAKQKTPVAIGINPHSSEQVVLGEIYSQIFDSLGYSAGVSSLSSSETRDAVTLLRSQPVDLVITCTGTLLESQDADTAEELKASDLSGPELSDATYDAMVATFPFDMSTVNPSPAEGCAPVEEPVEEPADGEMPEEVPSPRLPQNIVPVFLDGKFDHRTITRINFITRVMATDEIQEIAAEVDNGAPVHQAVSAWIAEYAGIMGTVSEE